VPPVIFDNGIPVIGEILEIVGDLLGTLGKTANDPEAEAIIDAEALRPVNGPPSISHSEDCKMCPQVMPECKCIRERDCIYHPQTCERCAHFTCDGPVRNNFGEKCKKCKPLKQKKCPPGKKLKITPRTCKKCAKVKCVKIK
jgi:hypothetical protein